MPNARRRRRSTSSRWLPGTDKSACAAGRDDAAQRVVELRERARRRSRLLAGDHARDARRQACAGTFCSSRQAAMSSVTSGLDAFIERRPGLVAAAKAWIHLGANIGAAQGPGNHLQASDDEMESMMAEAMTQGRACGSTGAFRAARCRAAKPFNVHRGGGRFISIIGSNDLFHNTGDRGRGRGRSRRHRTFRRRVCDGCSQVCEQLTVSPSCPSPREAGRGWRARSCEPGEGHCECLNAPHPPRFARHPLPVSRGEGKKAQAGA